MNNEDFKKPKNENPLNFVNIFIEKTVEVIKDFIDGVIDFVDNLLPVQLKSRNNNPDKCDGDEGGSKIEIMKKEEELKNITSNLFDEFLLAKFTEDGVKKNNETVNFWILSDHQKLEKFKQFIEDKNDIELNAMENKYSLSDRMLNLFKQERTKNDEAPLVSPSGSSKGCRSEKFQTISPGPGRAR